MSEGKAAPNLQTYQPTASEATEVKPGCVAFHSQEPLWSGITNLSGYFIFQAKTCLYLEEIEDNICSEDTVMEKQYTSLGIYGYHVPFYTWKHIWPSWDSRHSEFLAAELRINSLTPILVSYPPNCTTHSQFVLKILPIFFISVSSWPTSVRLQPGTLSSFPHEYFQHFIVVSGFPSVLARYGFKSAEICLEGPQSLQIQSVSHASSAIA